ncbi:hypothetical protein LT330_007439 [Penicillium expansum]|nr:hypothetical protein LT330_007439 [Penicillium expansum]KGO47360.1 hypothetical protein PEXP_081590 [Penicillium expansum]
MFSASTLLSMGTWAAVVLQATAIPYGPSPNKSIRDSSNDPCGPVGKFTQNPTIEKWNNAKTDDWLNNWWTENADQRTSSPYGFAGAFGQYALGQPGWSCQNNGNDANCDIPVCNNPKINALGKSTEETYYVLQALNNLHGFFLGLEQSFNIAAVVSALDNDEIVNNFWHDENKWDPTALKEILNAIATVLGVAVAGLGAPALSEMMKGSLLPTIAGAASGMVSGGVGAASIAVSSTDTSDITQANLGHIMAQAVNDIAGSFISTNNELMFGHGYGSSSEDIRTYLQGGSWVNYPGLQKNGARDSMIAIMQSMMINSLWRMQRVFIIGGGACGDGQDIGHGIAGSGDNTICDDNNRAWYLYYWQKQNGPSTKTDGWVARPWGSDRMGASPIYQGSGPFWKNLNPLDAVKSSLKSFQAAGNNYSVSTMTSRMGEIFASGANAYSEGASMEGVWTIPVCDVSKTINNPDYIYSKKGDILHPYGYDERPYWCGPICGMDKDITTEFYKAANFKDGFEKPFLSGCEAWIMNGDGANGIYWDWTTNTEYTRGQAS